MKRWMTFLAALACASLCAAAPASAAPSKGARGAAAKKTVGMTDLDRQIVVRFKSGTSGSDRAAARRSAKAGLKRGLSISGAQLLTVDRGQSVSRAIAALNRNANVRYAEPNRRRTAFRDANDTYFADFMWGLKNTGQTLGGAQTATPGADIDAPGAWDSFTGSSGVVVAVVDEGVAYDHPDLDGNLWTNQAEAAGSPGVDDDANGYVDDVRGVDTVDMDTDPRDFGGHGTHVAGTIAAEGNNSLGITGVVWDAQIMPVRVLGAGGGSDASVAEGFDYAGRMGARIVNASLGGEGDSELMLDAVRAHPETLFVVAAGNESVDNDSSADGNGNGVPDKSFPCSYTDVQAPNLICIAATDAEDALASFSNYGATTVDLAAPGVNILSALAERSGSLRTDTFGTLTGWTGDWVSFSDAALDSSGNGEYGNGVQDIMTMSSSIDVSGRTGCTLGMWIWTDIQEPVDGDLTDALWVERSTDGGASWEPVALFYGYVHDGFNGYANVDQIDLRADGASTVKIRYRFETDASNDFDYEGVWLDETYVNCTGAYAPDSYTFLDGTSMATPHVAGAAALLLSARPSATVAQLRTALLAPPVPDMLPSAGDQDKLVTGARLNVNKSLEFVKTFPEVATGAATDIAQTVATLGGTVNPHGTATQYRFEYGPTDSYGQQTPLVDAGSGSEAVSASAALTGLAAATKYHYRLVAVRGSEVFPGADRTFTTLAAPSTGGTTGGTGGTTTTPAPTPSTTTTTAIDTDPVGTMARTAKVSCRRKGSRRTCRVTSRGATKVSITIKKGRRTLARGSGRPGRTIKLRGRLKRGRYRVTIVLRDAKGNKATIRRTFRL